MTQKLLACDVDGTLILHEDQHIAPTDLKAIQKFREAGHIFALCTGRTLVWTLPILEKHNIQTDALILCNGSTIFEVDPSDHLKTTEIANNKIPNKIGLEILEYYYNKGNCSIYWDDGIYTYEIADRLLSKSSSIIQDNYSKHISINEALLQKESFVTLGITTMTADINDAELIKKEILSRWGQYIHVFRNQFFLDVAPQDSSKGLGITFLTKHLNKKLEIYGVGDSFNDLSMFQTVGKSNAFLMKNGEDSLQEFADHRVGSVAECIDYILSLKD